jgi:hypothetical protein
MKKLKLLIVLAICILIASPLVSQTTLVKENNVKATVNEKGDTVIALPYEGAKKILINLSVCEEVEKESLTKDTIINLLKLKVSLNNTIILKQEEINQNSSMTNQNCVSVIKNQNIIIDELRNQVQKEKRNKIIAILSGGLLTLLAILAF